MSAELTPEERGDLVEALLPEAAGLAVGVREETSEEIGARLAGLSRHELEALAVVLAAMVDPDRGLREALGWVDFDEFGERLHWVPKGSRAVRDISPDRVVRGLGVDMVAVRRALEGEPLVLSRDERRLAVETGIRSGMSYDDVAGALGMKREAVQRSWERAKGRARSEGRWVPPVPVGEMRTAA